MALSAFLSLWRDPLGTFAQLAREQGDLAHLQLGWQHLFLLGHPSLVHELAVTRHADFSKGAPLKRTRLLLGDGLLTSEAAPHRTQRRRIQPAFHRRRIEGGIEAMSSTAAEAQEGWCDGARIDASAEMLRLAQRVVARALFDTELSQARALEAGQSLDALVRGFGLLLLPGSQLLLKLPLPATLRLRRARERLDELIFGMISERRATGDRGDVLSTLLLSEDEHGQRMSPQLVRDEAMTLFLAGHDTTGSGLAWTWYLLSQHPEVEERWHHELSAVLAGRAPKADDLPRLPFTRSLFAESMRLFPPVPAVGRRAERSVLIGGRRIPKGSIVEFCPRLLHRDARFFPDPERFAPERWTADFERSLPSGAYIPFGLGPRHCIGMPFAWAAGISVLASLGQRWRMHYCGGSIETLPRSITLRPKHGLPMTLERR